MRPFAGPTVAALTSGGLDSAVMVSELAAAGERVLPVYVRAGLAWEAAELHWCRRFLDALASSAIDPLATLDVPVGDLYGDHWSTTGREVPGFDAPLESNYLPGRNLLLLSKTAVLCALQGIRRIAMASLADNPFPDGTLEFFRAFEIAAATALEAPLRVEAPFRSLGKAEVVRRGRHLPLQLTFSCIDPVDLEPCGCCTKCAERRRGFASAGVADPTRYRAPAD